MHAPPESERAALAGSPNRKSHKPPGLTKNRYSDAAAISTVSVCDGRTLLGHILETDAGQYRAVARDGIVLGSFKSRPEAAKAFSEVRP